MQVTMLPLDAVCVGDRLRVVDPDWVQGLRLSIAQIGLQTPITVGPADRQGHYRLIAGAHRLAACRDLGMATIAAVVCRLTVLEQRLVEIDENLCRRDLSALDRAAHLAERQAVYQVIYPETKRAQKARNIKGMKLLGHFVQAESVARFDLVAAEKMRISDRHIRRFLRLWERLVPDVRPALSTSLYADRFSELSLLSRQLPAVQRKIVAALLRPEAPARSVRAALAEISGTVTPPLSAAERKLRALVLAWTRADRRTRRKFLAHVAESSDLAALLPDGLLPAPAAEPARPALRIIDGGAS